MFVAVIVNVTIDYRKALQKIQEVSYERKETDNVKDVCNVALRINAFGSYRV